MTLGLQRMLAMRIYMRARHVEGRRATDVLEEAGLTEADVEDMYQTMAIANYEDRFVIPTTHREYAEEAFDLRGECGFSFGDGCGGGSGIDLFSHEVRVGPSAGGRSGVQAGER